MTKIVLVGQLKEILGKEFLELNGNRLSEILRKLSPAVQDVLDIDGKPSGKYIFLLNGVDSFVYGDDPEIKEEDTITIIPISHGG
ncbi:MAG: MoaD/ThiS family protein [Fervidicoccaceae archaeon]